MRVRDWLWVYLGTGCWFTRWAILLFYGAFSGVLVLVFVLFALLALTMAVSR